MKASEREREKRLTSHGPAIADAHLKAEAAQAAADDALTITESYTQQAYELSVQAETATAAAEEARLVGATAIAEDMLRLLKTELLVPGGKTLDSSSIDRMHQLLGTGSPYTLVLPSAVGVEGEVMGFRVPYSTTSLITLDGSGSELIHGQATRVMWAGESALLVSDGVGWHKIAGVSRPMACLIRSTAAQSIPTGALNTIVMNSTHYDPQGTMADLPNDSVVIRRTGYYRVLAYLGLASGLLVDRGIIGININGGTTNYVASTEFGAHNTSINPTLPSLAERSFVAGDFLRLHFFHTNSTNAARSTLAAGEQQYSRLGVVEVPSW